MSTNSRNCRVLVVDDDPELKGALCDFLADEGFEAIGFTDPAAALNALRAENFDLLLSDLRMPGTDGIALRIESLAIDPCLVGVIVTGRGSIETAVEAICMGAIDFVLKPFRIKQSLPVLERAMQGGRNRVVTASDDFLEMLVADLH